MPRPAAERTPLFSPDAGWLFLLPGLAILAAAVLIPAYDDLQEANWARDRAAAVEKHRLERIDRYGTYLDALEREDPSVVTSLAASQLNMVPETFEPIAPPTDPGQLNASVFPLLEPDAFSDPELPPKRNRSTLERLATGSSTRLWLIAGGALCVIIGLMPPSRTPVRSRQLVVGRGVPAKVSNPRARADESDAAPGDPATPTE